MSPRPTLVSVAAARQELANRCRDAQSVLGDLIEELEHGRPVTDIESHKHLLTEVHSISHRLALIEDMEEAILP